MAIQAGWYPDPNMPGQLRYWDGATWTAQVAPAAGAIQSQWAPQPQWGATQQFAPQPAFSPSATVGSDLGPRPVGMGQAVTRAFNKYASFNGRASRSEYWYFALASGLIGLSIQLMMGLALAASYDSYSYESASPFASILTFLAFLWGLISFLPSLAVLVRRLHDTGRSGGHFFWLFLPFVGVIVLLVFLCEAGQSSDNRYGPARGS